MMSRSLAAVRLAVALLLSGLLLLAACSGGGPRQREGDAGTARLLYDSFEQEYLLHRDAQALTLGGRLLDEYPDYPLADAVAAKMVTAAVRLPDLDRAQELAITFPERFPGSIHRDAAMKTAARGLADAGRPADGLRVLARLAAVQQGAARRSTEELALALAEPLDAALLNELVAEPGMRSLAPALRGLAAIEEEEAPAVVAGRIGVLTPLTGRYARFGNAFQAGVRQGLRSEDPQGTGPWEIVLEDTEGDPVPAALAARRLCRDEGCQLLIGALLSATTATAALVAQEHGVPLVSPTATNERLGELGASILQTNLTGPVEVEILARLATAVLLKQRFAIIRPDTPEGLNLATAFADKVTELGGEIVIESVFDPAATDFRSQVLALRETRPEVVFAPTTVDQMVLLGPQLDFYRVGALVLGPSEWNSSRLMERAGSVMERTVFPVSEVVYPPEWSAEFRADWPTAQYDEESTRLARSAYLATRLALRVMKEMPEATPQEITAALHARLSGRGADVAEPDGYAALVNLVEDGQPRSFPGHLYREAWLRQLEADSLARADSLALADSLGLARPDSAAARPDSTATAPPPLNPPRR